MPFTANLTKATHANIFWTGVGGELCVRSQTFQEDKMRGMGSVHICAKRRSVHVTSVFNNLRILVLCSQFQLLLLLRVAVCSRRAQVASVRRQQHHRGREGPISDVSQPLSCHHDEGPWRNQEQVFRERSASIYSEATDGSLVCSH